MTPDALADFYRLIGGALWHVQYLEDALVSFLSAKLIHERRCAGEVVSLEDGYSLLAERRRLTFGPLIESCAKRKIVRREHRARFDAFKEERHWLVHRSMVESGDRLYGAADRLAVFARINATREESIALKKLVGADMFAWCARHGVDVDAAERHAKAEVRRLRGY